MVKGAMSSNCYCAPAAPHTHGSFGFKALGEAVNAWQERLQAGLGRVINASDQNMGHLEEEILQKTRELQRAVLEEASQKKADLTPPVCPICKNKLSRVAEGYARSYETRFGPVTIRRARGWCRKCKRWWFPADQVLGLSDAGSCSPGHGRPTKPRQAGRPCCSTARCRSQPAPRM